MSRARKLDEAAAELRKSKRWLQDWLAKNPVDERGRPFCSKLGRTRLFDDADISLLRKAIDRIGAAPTFIYFVEMEGHIKIGKADNWRKRLSGIQTGSPFPAKLLLVLKATTAREKELHGMFADNYVRGEWFKDHPELRLYIKRRLQWCVIGKARK